MPNLELKTSHASASDASSRRSIVNSRTLAFFLVLLSTKPLLAEPMRLVKFPAVAADGARISFEWNGDLWVARSDGTDVRQLTTHPGKDAQPKFSPDGQSIAFLSDRDGGAQVFIVPVGGGTPRQITFHT